MMSREGGRVARVWLFGGAAVVLLVIVLVASIGWVVLSGAGAPGRPVPDYDARVLGTQREVALAELDGVSLLNMWATWCGPCRREMPALQAIYERYADEGLRVIGVNVDTSASDEDIAEFAEAIGVTFEIWRDPQNEFIEAFRAMGVPQTYLIAGGRILRHWQGRMNPMAPENLTSIKTALGLAAAPRADT
ncbi:MAG: TlpA family protein disulfide reductase [Nitrococcus sp.]|nr:TlpA family protein disulfide reductase [Nitrococcus sp.]